MQAGYWAPLTFVVVKISTIVVAPLSGTMLYPMAGLMFGFWPGILYIAIGDFFGYSIAFFISRYLGQSIVLKLISKNEKGILSKIVDRMSTVRGYIYTCLMFFFSPELLAYGAGLSKLKYWKFILILWPGSVLGTSVLVVFGSHWNASVEDSVLLSVLTPIIGGILIVVAGWLFMMGLKNEAVDSVESKHY